MNIPFLSFPKYENKGKKQHFHDSIFLIGSCFSDNIGSKILNLNIKTATNPFGVIYNSVSIYDILKKISTQNFFSKEELTLNNELYSSWLVGSNMSSPNQNEYLDLLNKKLSDSHQFLKNSSTIIITIGTSYVYELSETKEIVANCHKYPSSLFKKKLLSVEENYNALNEIVSLIETNYPNLHIVFTISPVRHIKDGIPENTISKSNIFSSLSLILKENSKISYYPAYEIMIDCLRDYRFYKRDMAHPNSLAVDLIFGHFIHSFFDERGLEYIADINKLNSARNHKMIHPNTEQGKKFITNQLETIHSLQKKYPEMNFSGYLEHFQSLGK